MAIVAPGFPSRSLPGRRALFLVLLFYSLPATLIAAVPRLRSADRDEVLSFHQFYEEFRDFDAIMARLEFIATPDAKLPHSPRLEYFGETEEGRKLMLVRVGRPDAPCKILVSSLLHAREWLSAMVVMRLIEAYAGATETEFRPDAIELLAVPVVNPDGLEYTKVDRFWRKNRQNIPGSTCVGVDINRNWPVDFNGSNSVSENPCDETFLGAAPFSTAEASALRDLLDREYNGTIALHLDVHSYGALVLGPWAYTNDPAPFQAKTNAVGQRIAKTLSDNVVCPEDVQNCELDYVYGPGSQALYLASGIFPDYTYSKGIMSFTLELRPSTRSGSARGFDISPTEIVPASETVNAAIDDITCLVATQTSAFMVSDGSPVEGTHVEYSAQECHETHPLFTYEPSKEDQGLESSPACFPAAARVRLENGSTVSMGDLQLGDKVLVPGESPAYSTVYAFGHRDLFASSLFIEISVSSVADTLVVSPTHLVINDAGNNVAAESLRIGDSIMLGDGSASEIITLATVQGTGLINPHTVDGSLVVDRFAVSSYTTSCPPKLASVLLSPARIEFLFFKSFHVAKFYALFLDFTRAAFCFAIRKHSYLRIMVVNISLWPS